MILCIKIKKLKNFKRNGLNVECSFGENDFLELLGKLNREVAFIILALLGTLNDNENF